MFYIDYKTAVYIFDTGIQPHFKSKLELESNLGEIWPVNCKFICCSIPTNFYRYSSSTF